jgi:LysR family hydrogen peroxide-inducible transcriptional activator
LKKMVEMQNGITILPQLALQDLNPQQLKMVRRFKPPAPVREVSLVTHRSSVKKRILGALQREILLAVPQDMQHKGSRTVVEY